MAQRRMFSRKITESDQFLDMPMSSQVLYFHINMQADDDGFVGNVKMIKRMIGASDDDLRLLITKEFLIPFESGVVVIKDWKIHNYIRNDRYNETFYKLEKSLLELDENNSYQVGMTSGIPNGYQMDTQVRLGKDRLGKDKKDILSGKAEPHIPFQEVVEYLNEKAETKYRHTGKKTQTLIKARCSEGFSLDDFKKVIDIKVNEWLNDKSMNKYLRPETLFGTKFESYLNQKQKGGSGGYDTSEYDDFF